MTKPERFPTRILSGKPQVLIAGYDNWLTCQTEEDASILALSAILEDEALNDANTGEEFALRLDKAADVFEKYRMRFGARFFRRRATQARRVDD